jgi:hypothetical protein
MSFFPRLLTGAQLIFDSNEENARLIGVEYVVSERLFKTLPEDEKKLWHRCVPNHHHSPFSNVHSLSDFCARSMCRVVWCCVSCRVVLCVLCACVVCRVAVQPPL